MRLALLLLLALLLPRTGSAQTSLADYDYANLTFRGVGFDIGRIWPDKVQPTTMWSLRLDLGYLGPAVRIAPTLSYWRSELRAAELDRLAERLSQLPPLRDNDITITAADLGQVDWSDLSLAVDAHIVWTVPLDIITFVGAGAALHALNGRGAFIENTFIENLMDSTSGGVAVMAGFEVQPLARLRMYGEARYTLVSDVRYPSLRLGAAIMLPPRRQ